MKLKKSYYLIFLFLIPSFSWSDIQYKPLHSPERHELSVGAFTPLKTTGNKYNIGGSLKYAIYFPEIINSIYPENYKNIFVPGLSVDISSLPAGKEGFFYDTCGKKESLYFFSGQLGLKGKISYFELVQPFGGFGFARSSCHTRSLFKNYNSQTKLKYYLSYGVFLSFKIFDKMSVYSLDDDYGINDFGIKLECTQYYTQSEKNKFNICYLGLQASF